MAAGGGRPIDLDEPAHQALLMLLGHQSEREVLRFRMRTSTAMSAQARDQDRHLGGRPPYGYRLVDAGPHPNRTHAAWGRRMHRLDLDPQAAPFVQWIFTRRLAGASAASSARVLNERRVPSPAVHDPVRNPHREGTVWTLRTVAAILANPRYTGRQVWNRQRTNHHESIPGDKRSSLGVTRDWNPRSDWIVSARRTHPALVSDAEFLAAQQVSAIQAPADNRARRYRLTGLLICGLCGRRLEAHWVHGRPGYRCRHGHTSARQPGERSRAVHWPEGRILTEMLYQLTAAGTLPPTAGPTELVTHLRSNDIVILCGAGQLGVAQPGADLDSPERPADATHPVRIPAQRGMQETPTTSIPGRNESGRG